MICNNFPNMQHSSAYAILVRTRNMLPFPSFARTAPFVCTCNICPHLHNFTVFGPISFFRLRHFPNALVYPGRPRPALTTPMAWHYSWHLIFFSVAVSCFFLHFPSDAISSSTYIRTRFSGPRRCVCSIVSWGFITTGRHSHGQVYARRLN